MRTNIGQTYFEVVQKLPLSTMGKQFLGGREGGTRSRHLQKRACILAVQKWKIPQAAAAIQSCRRNLTIKLYVNHLLLMKLVGKRELSPKLCASYQISHTLRQGIIPSWILGIGDYNI
jgi:hypothetical protein